MIREDDLREAIAECEGSRNPSASTCIKLASYYAILDHKFGTQEQRSDPAPSQYSFASAPEIRYGDSAFGKMVESKGIERCYPVIEETMEAMALVVPKLHSAMMRKLGDI